MGRLQRLSDAEVPEEVRGFLGTPVESVSKIFGHHPALWKAWWGFYEVVMRDGALPMRLKEIVRLRIATLNGCVV